MRDRCSIAILWIAVTMSACREASPYYCPGTPSDEACPDAPDGLACRTDNDCPALTPVCLDNRVCVQCTRDKADACDGRTPVCASSICRACQMKSECGDSEECLPDGACVDAGQIAYVKPASMGGTDNVDCTSASPCTKVTKALATKRPYVKIAGTNDEGQTITIDNQNVVLLGEPDAKLVRSSNGVHVQVSGTSQVEIYDLEISGATGGVGGAAGIGILMPPANTPALTLRRVKVVDNLGVGISAGGGSLTVAQSTIARNNGGGISVANAQFVIVGNVFFDNGDPSFAGGLTIMTQQSGMNRLEFNSFNWNQAPNGVGTAIQCTVAGTFTARNNVMSENGTVTNLEQVGGTCLHTYSIAKQAVVPPGMGNLNADPMFVDEAAGNLHLQAGSPALGAADPLSDLTGLAELDIDGERRTSPADMGADEAP